MKQINYKSDFKFYPSFTVNGNAVDIPTCDFDINLISSYEAFKASRRGDVYTNCKMVDSKLMIIADNHHLSVGIVKIEFNAYIPDADFADGSRRAVTIATDQIELVIGNGDEATDIDIQLALQYAVIDCYEIAQRYGYTGTKEEYYAALVSVPTVIPLAQEATTNLNALNTTVTANEAIRVDNENIRKINENTRVEDEDTRRLSETERETAENARKDNEASRQSEETKRIDAETARASNETDRKSAETERVNSESTRVLNETHRGFSEDDRVLEEAARVSNESKRVSAENLRVSNETDRQSKETERLNAESGRVDAENGRELAEGSRVSAETKRVSDFSVMETSNDAAVLNANSAADNANGKATQANDAATAANNAATSANNAAAAASAQTFTGSVYTNPFSASKAPRRIGDHAVNTTTFEIWEAVSMVNATTSWTRINAGMYGGTLATDLHAITISGVNTILATGLNVPNSNENWYVFHQNSNSGNLYAYQTAVGFTTGDRYHEVKQNGVWGAWVKDEAFTTDRKNQLDTNTNDISELKLGQGLYYMAGYDTSLSATPFTFKGNQVWARDISHMYLFDMTLNSSQLMRPMGELQRANSLRYVDGTFAPTVGITEAMRATCDVALYLDAAHANQYCAAGAFSATTFYNTYGMNQKLYDASGNEVRILRPWETTFTNYHMGLGFSEKVWLFDGVGNSGTTWKGLAQHDITWDGLRGIPLERTAISPCPATTIGNKTRNFFFLYNTGDSNTVSSVGQSGLCTLFANLNRTFPRVNDISQISNMNYARANNPTVTNPYPVAEGGYHAYNAAITRREILFGTNYLHNPSLFGSGISSNDTCNNETTFLANGGFKYKLSSDTIWSYCNFGSNPAMCYNNAGGVTNASTWLNSQYPKEQCMESQMAASFAKETGVAQNTNFTFYGSVYQYRNIMGVLGLSDGRMNVIVTKVLSQTISAFNASGQAANYDISCCLRMSLCDGMNFSGDIFRYWGGGYEQIGTCVSTVQPHTGDVIDLYLQSDQTKWTNTTDVTKNNLGKFDFESSYTKLATVTNLGDNYAKTRAPFSAWKTAIGGSLGTGQCYYQYDNNYWSTVLNQRVRVAVRLSGAAIFGLCSPRSMAANYPVSSTAQINGGSAQILIG